MKITMRRVGAALLALGASTCSGVVSAQRDSFIPPWAFQPSSNGGAFVAGARGSWSAPGLGYVFDIGRDRVDVYNRSGRLCWRDPLQSGPVSSGDQGPLSEFTRGYGAFDIVFSATPENSFQLHAQRVAGVPRACTRAVDRSRPLYVFDAIASTLIEFYPFSARRHVDWTERWSRLRPRAASARTEEELKSVVAELLAGFKDMHTAIGGEGFLLGRPDKPTMDRLYVRYERGAAPTAGEGPQSQATFPDWFAAWRDGQQRQVFDLLEPATRRQELAGNAVSWGVLEGDIGYLAIEAMDRYEDDATLARQRELIAATLDRALAALQGTRALIVDVSNNSGGSGEIALDIASRFTDRRRLVLSLALPNLRERTPQPYFISRPGQEHARYAKSVYVLTSEATVSAGEWFAVAMRSLPQATLVGQSTQGALTGDFQKGLPNGWILTTSVAISRDSHGVDLEVRGIAPDVGLEVYPGAAAADAEFDRGRARAVEALARAIAGR